MDRHRRGADGLAHIFQRRVVVGLRRRDDGGLGFDLRHDLAVDPVIDRARLGARNSRPSRRRRPWSSSRSMRPRWLPQKPAMTAGLPCSVPAFTSTPGMLSNSLPPGNVKCWWPVRITSMPSTFARCKRRVLLAALALAARDARMAERHDDVGAGLLEIRHMLLRRIDDVDGGRLAVEMRLVPLHDLRRHEADHADLDRLLRAGLIDDLAVEDEPGLLQRLAIRLDDVGADEREFRRAERVLQEVEAVVELVIAERAAIVVQRRSWRRPWDARRPSSCRCR